MTGTEAGPNCAPRPIVSHTPDSAPAAPAWHVYAEEAAGGRRWDFATEQEARNHHALALLDGGAWRADVVRVGDPVPYWVVEGIVARLTATRSELARLRQHADRLAAQATADRLEREQA